MGTLLARWLIVATLLLGGSACVPVLGGDGTSDDDDVTSDDDDDDDVDDDDDDDGAFRAEVEVDPQTLDFGAVPVGDSYALPVRIGNGGSDILQLQDLVLSNVADFALTNLEDLPALLSPGESFELGVACVPSALGEITALLVVATNDADQPEVPVQLLCEGA